MHQRSKSVVRAGRDVRVPARALLRVVATRNDSAGASTFL